MKRKNKTEKVGLLHNLIREKMEIIDAQAKRLQETESELKKLRSEIRHMSAMIENLMQESDETCRCT